MDQKGLFGLLFPRALLELGLSKIKLDTRLFQLGLKLAERERKGPTEEEKFNLDRLLEKFLSKIFSMHILTEIIFL